MKLITLNIWGGIAGDILIDFFKKYSGGDIDFFLLQEVHNQATEKTSLFDGQKIDAFREISEVLPNHIGYFAPALFGEWGLATFVKKSIGVSEVDDIFVHRKKDSMVGKDGTTIGKNMQYVHFSKGGKRYTLLNLHGLWNGKGKTDTEDRLRQSEKVQDFIDNHVDASMVLAGDFNLRPDTKSLELLEKDKRNLIKEYGIQSTRTSYYKKPEKFADYVLVSPDIEVKDFKVLPDEVSDHSALFLEFN
jgi:endonuclease/exonuclease/phosphatase family metal-dependent hydrolase